MIEINYDENGNPDLIIERIGTSWKVTRIYFDGNNNPVRIGEGDGWSIEDAFRLASQDLQLRGRVDL